MAFQRKGGSGNGGGHSKPAMSISLSAKNGKDYEKCPFTGVWPNEGGGPAFKGTLKGESLTQVLEFLSNCYDAGLSVSVAIFDNAEGKSSGGKPGFKKPSGFKKPNPFKKQQEPEPEGEEDGEGPEF